MNTRWIYSTVITINITIDENFLFAAVFNSKARPKTRGIWCIGTKSHHPTQTWRELPKCTAHAQKQPLLYFKSLSQQTTPLPRVAYPKHYYPPRKVHTRFREDRQHNYAVGVLNYNTMLVGAANMY